MDHLDVDQDNPLSFLDAVYEVIPGMTLTIHQNGENQLKQGKNSSVL